MRIRTRSYAAAFAASAGVVSVGMQQSTVTEALRSSSSPLRLSMPPISSTWICDDSDSTITTTTTTSTTSRIATRSIPTRRRQGRNHHHHKGGYTSRLCSARTDADTEADIRRSKKNYGAPVVDSTLLRFISQQKKVPEVFREASVVIEDGAIVEEQSKFHVDMDDYDSEPFNSTLQISKNENENENNSDAEYDATTDVIKQKLTGGPSLVEQTKDQGQSEVCANTLANTDSTTASSSWMAQFKSTNVAQMLMANGGVEDETLAKTAGDAVERYCVVRTARQRIRRFLKERDTLWQTASDGNNNGKNNNENIDDEGYDFDGATPSYGLEDVLAVMKDYGLTGSDICALLTHSPNLALRVPSKSFKREGQTENAESLEETLERSLSGLLLSELGLRKYDARKILRTCPGLLCVRGSKSAVQVITIMTKLGVSTKSLANNKNKNSLPVLLSRSPAGLFRLVSFLSSTAVRMPLEQIGPLLRRREGRELMDALLPVPNTSYSKAAGNTNQNNNNNNEKDKDVDASVSGSSSSSAASSTTLEDDAAAWSRTRFERQERIERTYAGMTQTARILKAQIGTQDLSKVVAAYPKVLLLDAKNQILPVARYLMGGLGIWQNDLSSVLQLYPTLLGTKIDDLERVVSYVLTLGVDEDDLAGIFRAFPGLFATKVEDMEAVVSYLESIGVQDIGAFVTKLPPVLGYSVEKDLKPKWEFLKKVCLQPEFELKEFPAYFSYPFERVIKTRFNYLAYKGISIRFVSMRIDTVLRFGDVDFATKVALDDDWGEAFENFARQRGSSSSKWAVSQRGKSKNKRKHNNRNNNYYNRNSAVGGPQRLLALAEEVDNAKDLAELNRIIREAAPLRNRSLGNSLPSLKPNRPKRKQKRNPKQQQKQRQQKIQNENQQKRDPQQSKSNSSNNSRNRNRSRTQNQNGEEEGTLPYPA